MTGRDEIFASRIFLYAVLPLLRVIVESTPSLSKAFSGRTAVVQVSAKDLDSKHAVHFEITEGQWKVKKGAAESPDLELEFKSLSALNGFFSGKNKKLPKIIGWQKLGLTVATFKALLAMSAILSAKKAPDKECEKDLLVKCMFYLLSSGISQLNKAGHPEISKWVQKSPDRIYAWVVDGRPDLSAYLRVKAGNSKAGRGEYIRSKPFFTMRFSSVDSALGILLETDDFLEASMHSRIIMEGAPEYGAMIGEYMKLVGSFAK
ncbi:MAG: hypothetical protein ACOZCL_17435 [Bacillota bacterium]